MRARVSPGSPLGCSWPCWYTSQQHSPGLQDQSKSIWRRVSCVILGVGDPSLGPLPGRPFISSSARPFTQLLPGSSRGRGSLGTDLTLDEAGEGASHWLQTLVPFWLRPVEARPRSSISSGSHCGQCEATGRLFSDNFLEPYVKAPFCQFLCNAALAATRVRRSRLGPGFGGPGGSVASVLSWSSRAQGPGPPLLLSAPRPGDLGGPAVLHAGGRAGGAAPSCGAAVATGAHSIRTCRRTLNITEATM